jgi:hypothetical protein
MKSESKHEHFCFAGQPAPCEGYFLNDVLPCVCGAEGDVVTALSGVAVPAPLGGAPVPAKLARATLKPSGRKRRSLAFPISRAPRRKETRRIHGKPP